MAISLLGSDELRKLLAGHGRVTLVNRTVIEDDVTIVAFALVRHIAATSAQREIIFDLALAAGESVSADPLPPLDAAPAAVEMMLRLRLGAEGAVVDAYAATQPLPAPANVVFEFGVKRNATTLGPGEHEVPGFPEFATYALPTE